MLMLQRGKEKAKETMKRYFPQPKQVMCLRKRSLPLCCFIRYC